MESIVKDREQLPKLMTLPYHEIFKRSDEDLKISFLSRAFDRYFNRAAFIDETEEEKEYCETLRNAIGVDGIWMALSTVEGNRTYSKNRNRSILSVIEETDRILNDEGYRKRVSTEFTRNTGLYETVKTEIEQKRLGKFPP